MPNLALSNIRRRKLRSAVTILAVGLGVALFLVLVGVTSGSINELISRIKNVGADIMVQPADSSFFLALKSSLISDDMKTKMEGIKGVQAVAPVLTWAAKVDKSIHVIYGIDPDSFSKVGAKITLIDGRDLQNEFDIVIDKNLAGVHKLKLGSKLRLLNKDFQVVGICKQGIGAKIFMLKNTLQKRLDQGSKVSVFFLKCDTPEVVKRVASEIESKFPNLKVNISEEVATLVTNSLAGLSEFVAAMSAFTILVSSLVVLLAMYTTIYERGREIGILKALGASNFYIIREVMTESLILSLIGVFVGHGFAYLARDIIADLYPTLTVEFTTMRSYAAFGIGTAIGVIGAILPAVKAAKKDPVLALKYE